MKQSLVVHVGVLGGGGRDMVAPVWPERMNSGGEGSEAADVISAMGSCIPFGQLLFARTLATQVAVCLLFFLVAVANCFIVGRCRSSCSSLYYLFTLACFCRPCSCSVF